MSAITQEYQQCSSEEHENFIDTANFVSAKKIYREFPIKTGSRAVPMIHIPKNKKSVKNIKPIIIKLYIEDEIYFAENEALAICGNGETIQEAIKDFMLHLIHFYEYYKKIDENKLIGQAIRLKKLYTELFVEENNAD